MHLDLRVNGGHASLCPPYDCCPRAPKRGKLASLDNTSQHANRNGVDASTAHRIQVVMPEGFEHRAAEVASANIRSTGTIKFETKGTHSSLANVVQTPEGVAA